MKGYAHYILMTIPPTTRRYENVRLTYIGSEGQASLSREDGDEPEELICLESVQVDILTDYSLDLEGFVCDRDGSTYHKCALYFVPDR